MGRVISPDLPQPVQAALAELEPALRNLYGDRLRGVYLYGSYARGDWEEGSDVDVLVALAGDVTPAEEIGRTNPTVAEISRRHDLLIAELSVPESWLQERRHPFYANVRREAIRL
jgi:uncharacterized protein